MPRVPQKPIDQMTDEEVRQWKAWLVDCGTNLKPFPYPQAPGTSTYDWDSALNATVETTPQGRRYRLGILGNELVRLKEFLRE